jgi:23S rRNA pseudouridine1911/1915/1917 synthase
MIEEEIPAALAGERLDRVVALIGDLTRADSAVLVSNGGATVDGVVQTSGKVRLAVGQVVTIDMSMAPIEELPQPEPGIQFGVVHADDDVIVVDKPCGLVVHPGAGHRTGTLVNGLLAAFPEISGVGESHRPGIVHRLDVGTSGLLVVARTSASYHYFVQALATRNVGRAYRTLVWGHVENPVGVIEAPIGRDPRDPLRMAVVVDGKPARTHYQLLQALDPPKVTLLECRLETGRTHQIRVHLAAVGHPVVGDATYGGARDALVVPRPFLHAARLSFEHPVTGEPMEFASDLPADLAGVLEGLVAQARPASINE